MKIAVTYDNGMVFQHFGHTEQFKVYDVEDGAVRASGWWTPTAAGTGPWPASCGSWAWRC